MRTSPNRAYLDVPVEPSGGRVALSAFESRDMRAVAEHVVERVSDLRWLSRGDSVFVKVACNSPYDHPAVTSPEAVEAMVGLLRDRGAGTVYVGDQSGVEHVRLTKRGRVASTAEMMKRNGLLAAVERSGATLHNFDEQGFDAGYRNVALDFENHWEDQLYLADIVERVDHVVVLSRLGAHALAGYTAAVKNAVGWTRDDSRRVLHQKGGSFFEKLAEINHARPLRDKFRLAVTLGDKALLEVGPDIGGTLDFRSVVGFASQRLVDHDAFASALLDYFEQRDVSVFSAYSPYPEHADFWNRGFVEDMWGEQAAARYEPMVTFPQRLGIAYDSCLSHLAALQGYRPERIVVRANPVSLDDGLRAHLRRYGTGLFAT